MRRVMLSHPLAVLALVSHYLTNKLIAYFPILGQRTFAPKTIRFKGIIRYYTRFPRAIPDPRAR